MDPPSIKIQPSQISIDSFRFSNIGIIPLQNSAWVNVELLSEGVLVKTVSLRIDGEDYVNWGSDTPYLINWVCSKLNFTRIEV